MYPPLACRMAAGGRMHRAAIVPYDDVAGLPFVAVLGVGLQHVPIELGQQPVALFLLHAGDTDDMCRIDIQRFAPGLRVHANHIVDRRRRLLILGSEPLYSYACAATIAELDLEGSDPGLELLGERIIGSVHRRKERVAAIARNLECVELSGLADLRVPGPVRVPALAAVEHQLV